jgi:aldose sugar dehydrogenase
MNKRSLAIILFSACFFFQSKAQSDKELVSAVIEMYFDGWTTSDSTKVGKAMHSSCQLKLYRDGAFIIMPREKYLSGFKTPKAKDKDTHTSILFIDITGNIGQAKAKIETATSIFIDYFNLIKTNEGWFIVDKVATRTNK